MWRGRWPPEVVAACAITALLCVFAPMNTDTGWAMVIGRGVLGGQRLYADLLETNPPAFFWLMLIPAWASRHVPVGDDRLIGGFLALLLVLSTILSLDILSRPVALSRRFRFAILTAFYAALVLPFLPDMGQREQLATVLVLPYTLLAARAAGGDVPLPRALRIFVAVFGGIGFAIKPFFLAAWGAIELAVIICRRTRRVRTEFLVVAAVQAVFVVLVWLVTPDYFTRIVPLARATYDAYGRSRLEIVLEPRCWVLGVLAVTAMAAGVRRPGRAWRFTAVAGAATFGWLFEYVVQGKGWSYQFIPAASYAAVTFASLAYAVMVGDQGSATATDSRTAADPRTTTDPWLPPSGGSSHHPGTRDRVSARPSRAFVAAVLLLTAGWAAAGLPWTARRVRQGYGAPYRGALRTFARRIEARAAGQPVYMLSTSMWPIFPAVNLAGSPWAYRYHFLWPIPGLYAGAAGEPIDYRPPDRQGAIERELFDAVIEDLTRTPPRLLFIDRRDDQQAMHGRQFDFLEYFSASPEFRTFMRGYHRVEPIGPWDVYERYAIGG